MESRKQQQGSYLIDSMQLQRPPAVSYETVSGTDSGPHIPSAATSSSAQVHSSMPEDAVCRICLDATSSNEFQSGQALKLGCWCTSALDVVHKTCAVRWFSLKGDTKCEVCGGEAKGLPEDVRLTVRLASLEVAAQRQAFDTLAPDFVVGFGGLSSEEGLGLTDLSVMLTQRTRDYIFMYTFFCLLPTCLSTAALLVFYSMLRLDVWLTVILSIFISTTTMLHWLLHPRRGLLHLMLVNVVVASVLGITWVLVMTNEGRAPVSLLAVLGSVLGGIAGLAVFYGVILPCAAQVQACTTSMHLSRPELAMLNSVAAE
eukprot:jgi/Chrzof1/11324/Cz05g32150.t1